MRLFSSTFPIFVGALETAAVHAFLDDQVDWATFLGRHDAVWQVGSTNQDCRDTFQYDAFSGHCGESNDGFGKNCGHTKGSYDCVDPASCADESRMQCDSTPGCQSFGLSKAWHSAGKSQLYTTSAASRAATNKDWTLWVRNESLPKQRVCRPSSAEQPFTEWVEAPFVGNGLVGGLLRYINASALRIDLGRTDVWDHRTPGTEGYVEKAGNLFMKPRLPIGHLEVALPEGCAAASWRMVLHTAELLGNISCGDGIGHAELRLWTPSQAAGRAGLLLEVSRSSPEFFPREAFAFVPEVSQSTRHPTSQPEGYKPNPPALQKRVAGIDVWTQRLLAGGDYATALAWTDVNASSSLMWVSIANDWPASGSDQTAVSTIQTLQEAGVEVLRGEHRTWWAEYYPASFVSVAQSESSGDGGDSTLMEAFYWIQMYKLASSTRAEGPAMDLMGPWFQPSSWLYYWFDLNEQLQYWPIYTANRLSLGAGLVSYVDQNRSQLATNAGKFGNDSYAIGGACSYDMDCYTNFPGIVGDGPWICHNLYMQARYGADDAMMRDTVFPLLRGMINFYRHHMFEDDDGVLHLPHSSSPEYPSQDKSGTDTNFDIALFEWGLQTLIEVATRLSIDDPLLPQWQDEIARLTPGPIQPGHGYMVDSATPFAVLHRHFSHAFHIYPLHLVDFAIEENRSVMVDTLDTWFKHTCGSGHCPNGYTYTGVASMSVLVGRLEEAIGNLTALMHSSEIHSSTMYEEGKNPVIESPLAAASVVTELLLTSWGGRVRVFPGVPESWPDAVFRDLLAEGGIEVSAVRRGGETQFVQVRSVAGEAFVLQLPKDLEQQDVEVTPADAPVKRREDGSLQFMLAKGQAAVVTRKGAQPDLAVKPLPGSPNAFNYWGTRPTSAERVFGNRPTHAERILV